MMNAELRAAFEKLTAEGGKGFQPFRWQQRLLHCFLDANLPEAVDIPTGLGKTSVMALWLIALAEGASLPRRLVYVVDRRAVVDQATRFAERLRENMDRKLATKLGLGDEGKLPISTLRGGFADNRDWLEDPSKPAIVVGTIDMVGSRLLFEGYGVSRNMRPYHAGFLGVDTLVVLDEAHLCPPFEALLQQIANDHEGRFGPRDGAADAAPPFRLVSLSATGRETSRTRSFQLAEEDKQEPLVRQRLSAVKQLAIRECEDAKKLPDVIAECAVERGCDPPTRVLVFCDRRTDAIKIKEHIDKALKPKTRTRAKEDEAGHHSELLVGARRVYERRKLERWLEDHGFLGGAQSPPDAPTFLVATSAGEVGVDLDADHMVCDLVAFERMVQRLGRVNRRGGEGREAQIDVFAVPESPPKKPKPDAKKNVQAKYEKDLSDFNAHIARAEVLHLLDGSNVEGRHNANFYGIDALKSNPTCQEMVKSATTRAPLHPALTRPHLNAWSMTSLRQHEGRTEVAPWLRGWEEEDEPQTEVVWRRHLPVRRNGEEASAPAQMVARFLRCAPIHASEKLETLHHHIVGWLFKRAERIKKQQEKHGHPIEGNEIIGKGEVVALIVNRAGELIASAKLGDLLKWGQPAKDLVAKRERGDWERNLASATLILDSRIAGLQDGMLKEQSDAEVPTADADDDWQGLREDPASNRPVVKFHVELLRAGEGGEGLQEPPQLEDWRQVYTVETDIDAGGAARRGLAVYKWRDSAEDEDARSVLSKPQLLEDHAHEVAACVRRIAQQLSLPEEEAEALEIAARFHDDGKAAERWQNAMAAPLNERPYAKTSGGGNWRLLEGYRHEFGSLLKAERKDLPTATRDLILHLIAAHHGNTRPLIRSEGCNEGPPSKLETKAGEAALRFARLQKRYGPWGLAWREAILRAADQSASRDWDRRSMEQR